MAIIETLLLQDAVRLAGRLRMSTLLFALCCINYAWGTVAKPTMAVTGTDVATITSNVLYSQAVDGKVKMTCTATCDVSCEYEFTQGDTAVQNYSATAEYDIDKMEKSHAGQFKCKARDSTTKTDISPFSAVQTLTLTCGTEGNDGGCGSIGKCTAASGGELYCQCRIDDAKVYLSGCDECDGNDKTDCGTFSTCNVTPDPKKCGCEFDGTPKHCKVCKVSDNAGCSTDVKPYCKEDGGSVSCQKCEPNPSGTDKGCRTGQTCDKDSGKCEGTPSGTTGGTTSDDGGATDSKGTTGKHSDTTSSAGSVTSTACLVIASVVVALMI